MNKFLRRTVRYSGVTEIVQKRLRPMPNLFLAPIDLTIAVGKDDVLIDAGANVGDITSRFARTGATVYAFEPNPLCFGILSRRFRYTSNVKCFHQGVMDRPCTLTLSTPKAHEQWDEIDTTIASSFVFQETKDVTSTDVECIDLAAFISRIPHVRLLKLDIEGSEIPVIHHLMQTGAIDKVDLTVVETHERFSAELENDTARLRSAIAAAGMEARIRLDWQ